MFLWQPPGRGSRRSRNETPPPETHTANRESPPLTQPHRNCTRCQSKLPSATAEPRAADRSCSSSSTARTTTAIQPEEPAQAPQTRPSAPATRNSTESQRHRPMPLFNIFDWQQPRTGHSSKGEPPRSKKTARRWLRFGVPQRQTEQSLQHRRMKELRRVSRGQVNLFVTRRPSLRCRRWWRTACPACGTAPGAPRRSASRSSAPDAAAPPAAPPCRVPCPWPSPRR